jgi:hypothetical protein
LEEDGRPQPRGRGANERSVLIDALKKKLRWLTTRVFVESISAHGIRELTVENRQNAERLP